MTMMSAAAAAATSRSSSLRRLLFASTNSTTTLSLRQRSAVVARRGLSSSTKSASSASSAPPSASLLAGDAGHKATHLHHHMTTLLVFTTPLYLFALPDSYTNSYLDKGCGLVIAGTMAAHSWIGLNYVATDYVPKISKSLLGPARVVNLALGVVTLAGLGKIAVGERGLRGTVMGLWRPAIAVEAKTSTTVGEENKKE